MTRIDNGELMSHIGMSERRFSKGHRAIASYIQEHYDKAAFMTAARLAEQVGVSESTVVRFAIALGYEGYPELQRALQEMIRNRLTSVQRVDMASALRQEDVLQQVLKAEAQNIRQTLEAIDQSTFDQVITRLLDARRVYVAGVRSSAPLAQFMGYYLGFLLDNVTVATPGISDVVEQIVRIGEQDLLFVVSFPRYSVRAIDAMRFAKRKGAFVVALTDSEVSQVGAAADMCLIAHNDMTSFVDSLVAPLSVVNALMVGMSLRKRDQLKEYFTTLEGLWSEIKVYSQEQDGKHE